MGGLQLEAGSIPEISFSLETGRAVAIGRTEAPAGLLSNVERYVATALSLLSDLASGIHVAYDRGLRGNKGGSARIVVPAGSNAHLAAALSSLNGSDVDTTHLIVVFGSEFSGWRGPDAAMRALVAADLTVVIDRLYPIESSGPISRMLPYLTQIAGNVLLPGAPAGEDDLARQIEMTDRVGQAIGRAYRGFAQTLYPDAPNAFGQLASDFPAWPYLADMVAEQAGLVAPSMLLPVSQEDAATVIQAVVAQSMRNLGVEVIPATVKRAL